MTVLDRRVVPEGMVIGGWRAPDGWAHRRFHWHAAAVSESRGSLLFQAGRADFIEKYVEPVAHWHKRGWNVAGFDWRGQGGSGRVASDPATNHLASLDSLVDDLAAFLIDWRAATPPPHVVIGHSMGGHVVLRLLAERDVTVDAAVLVAPMLALNSGRLPDRAASLIARAACGVGLAARRAWDQPDRPGPARRLQERLTHCRERHADSQWWKAQHPELGLGPPSWGWLAAAYRSIAKLAGPGQLERVATPILLLAAATDRLVRTTAIRAAAARLPDAQLKIYPDSAHELLHELDPVRLSALARIDTFLDARAPRR